MTEEMGEHSDTFFWTDKIWRSVYISSIPTIVRIDLQTILINWFAIDWFNKQLKSCFVETRLDVSEAICTLGTLGFSTPKLVLCEQYMCESYYLIY